MYRALSVATSPTFVLLGVRRSQFTLCGVNCVDLLLASRRPLSISTTLSGRDRPFVLPLGARSRDGLGRNGGGRTQPIEGLGRDVPVSAGVLVHIVDLLCRIPRHPDLFKADETVD